MGITTLYSSKQLRVQSKYCNRSDENASNQAHTVIKTAHIAYPFQSTICRSLNNYFFLFLFYPDGVKLVYALFLFSGPDIVPRIVLASDLELIKIYRILRELKKINLISQLFLVYECICIKLFRRD